MEKSEDRHDESALLGSREVSRMSSMWYLGIMLGIILVVAAVTVPGLLRKKCGKCGAVNPLDAPACKTCNAPFPAEE